MSAIIGGSAAMAGSTPRFRAYDLGILPGASGGPSIALGINNLGQIVGESNSPVFPQRHAFIRVTTPAFGLANTQMYDLNTLYGLTLTGPSLAHDINVNGQIVGQVGPSVAQRQAMVWELFEPGSASTIALGFLPSGTQSVANAINDHADAIVVGSGDGDTPCFGGTLPFRAILDGTPTLEILGGTNQFSAAFDVNNLTPAMTGGAFGPPILPCPIEETGCTNDRREPAAWNGLTIDLVPPVAPPPLFREDASRGVNNAGNLVGYGFRPFTPQGANPIPCFQSAAFWVHPDASPVILGDIMPAGQEESRSTAEAIREPFDGGRRQVVGWNVSADRALLWEFDPTTGWSVVNLTLATNCPCDLDGAGCPTGSWTIRQAHDINDNGWIVGLGFHEGFGLRAVLLIPIATCVHDLNDDGNVDGIDLGILLANWSIPTGSPGCQGSIPCPSDYNCDNVVDGIDLGLLLANWDPTGLNCGGGSSLQGGEESMMSVSGTPIPSTIEQIIQSLIDSGQHALAEQLQQLLGAQ